MSIEPLGARALIEPDRPKKTTEGGIELPEQVVAGTVEGRGTIRAFGTGEKTYNLGQGEELNVGDAVLYKPHAGYDVRVTRKSKEGTTHEQVYLIVRVEDIIGVDREEKQ